MSAQPSPDNSKLAIVTGTTAGIGAEVATQLLAAGWSVIGVARRKTQHDSPRYSHLAADLSDAVAASRRIEEQLAPILRDRKWSRLGLVNNAASPDLLGVGERTDVEALQRVFTVNAVVPVWLMGFVARHRAGDIPLRIVNVSSSAARDAAPGLLAYGSSKAALRMAGMVLASEWESTAAHAPHRRNIAVQSYEPGVVETDMQKLARSLAPETFPWGGLFHDFVRRGIVVTPAEPAAEIVAFLEDDKLLGFSEARLS
jgi:NAD(P)-dependent dehydrogenase (short-subunit alcohol dehydrogenase family)